MARNRKPTREQMVRVAQRLVNMSKHFDPLVLASATKVLDRILMRPMTEILDKVPGDTQIAKARTIGVTRETLYGWIKGRCRPYPDQAQTLAKLTGFDAAEIRGVRSR